MAAHDEIMAELRGIRRALERIAEKATPPEPTRVPESEPRETTEATQARRRRLCDIHSLAEQIGRTESATWWMHRRGLLPPSTILGGRRIWRQGDIDDWLHEQFDNK